LVDVTVEAAGVAGVVGAADRLEEVEVVDAAGVIGVTAARDWRRGEQGNVRWGKGSELGVPLL
jgi:hypothetical protein